MCEIDIIAKELFIRKEDIFRILVNKKKDVNKYFIIKSTFESGQIDDEFKKIYSSFYKLNRTPNNIKFKEKHFELLKAKEQRVDLILRTFYDITCRWEIVFTSKLLHTISNVLPLYDSNVGKIFNLPIQQNSGIQGRIDLYENLKACFLKLLNNTDVTDMIEEARINFKWDKNDIGDVKILDFLLWAKE